MPVGCSENIQKSQINSPQFKEAEKAPSTTDNGTQPIDLTADDLDIASRTYTWAGQLLFPVFVYDRVKSRLYNNGEMTGHAEDMGYLKQFCIDQQLPSYQRLYNHAFPWTQHNCDKKIYTGAKGQQWIDYCRKDVLVKRKAEKPADMSVGIICMLKNIAEQIDKDPDIMLDEWNVIWNNAKLLTNKIGSKYISAVESEVHGSDSREAKRPRLERYGSKDEI